MAGEGGVQSGALENTPEAIEIWASELEQRFGGRPIAVALEQPRGAVVAVLSKYAHLVLFPVHPNALAHYRKSFYPSGAKSDPSDAELLLELLVRHRDRLRPLQPDTVRPACCSSWWNNAVGWWRTKPATPTASPPA